MIIQPTNTDELKRVFIEALLNFTDKVTKISQGSVLNGVGYGIAKLNQKTLKDLSVIEAHLFLDSAYGVYLDNYANLNGYAARLQTAGSSGYVRLVGAPGTTYVAGTHTFVGQGVNFILRENTTIPQIGYCYASIYSSQQGANTNVEPLSITKVSPVPTGHNYCINEYMLTGGREAEDDDDFRKRLKDGVNELSRETRSFLEQVFRKINPLVLRVYNQGIDEVGDIIIGVSKINGAYFDDSELSTLLNKAEKFLSLNELKPDGGVGYGIKIKNIPYFEIDVSARVDIEDYVEPDQIRIASQLNFSKKIDYRYWQDGDIVDWVSLINCIKSVNGVKRVLDNYFFPNNDIIIPRGYLPRFRGFILLNLQGQIISNSTNTLNPIYYPNNVDFNYQSSVLSSI